jgi:hypothetical protein
MVANAIQPNALDSYGVKSPSRTDPIKAMEAAGALFGLKKMRLSEFAGVPANDDLHVVVRTDTGQAIGQVGNSYEVFPNEAFFAPTTNALIKETGARIDRFQMLDHGTRSFMRLSWPEDRNLVIGRPKVGDVVGRRCTLSTSHDGKYAGKFTLMLLRLICSNGMTAPVGSFEMALTHTVGGHQQLVDLQKLIPMIELYIRQFEVAATMLVETPCDPQKDEEKILSIIQKMVDPNAKAGKKKAGGINNAQERINSVMRLFDGGQPGADTVECKGTGWGLYQAGNHYFTHLKDTRGEGEETLRRFKSLIPGGPASREIVRAWGVTTEGLGLTEKIKERVAAIN